MKDPNWLRENSRSSTPDDDFTINPDDIDRASCSVRGKTLFREQVTGVETLNGLEPILRDHGRNAIITLKMKDGTKMRVRGNGKLMLGGKPDKMTEFAKKIIRQDRYHPMLESITAKRGSKKR